jgi:hypothetical protein
MTSFIHWVQIDASAAAKAEQALNGDLDGEVRDEIGFMAVHHGFANRFFPGTSVLHTRLRYMFFVPGLMLQVAADGGSASLVDRLRRAEAGVKDQLKESELGKGVIGRRSLRGRMPSQLPSAVYWNALQQWGFLRPYADGTYPTRLEALKSLAETSSSKRRSSRDDDGVAIDGRDGPFVDDLPALCKQVLAAKGGSNFKLDDEEKHFLAATIGKAGSSLFARLMQSKVELPKPGAEVYDVAYGWPDWILKQSLANERKALKIASDAAALVCIGRAVYAAMVQELRERDGITSGETDHRDLLDRAIGDYGSIAKKLSIDDLKAVFAEDTLPKAVVNVLVKTQAWLRSGHHNRFMDLHGDYSAAETPRKGPKSRLRTGDHQRRREWNPDEFSQAMPLHYRVSVVHQLVRDMQS